MATYIERLQTMESELRFNGEVTHSPNLEAAYIDVADAIASLVETLEDEGSSVMIVDGGSNDED